MPIRPYLGSRAFEPGLVKEMGEAFDLLCRALNLSPADRESLATQRVANAVIKTAEGGATHAGSLFSGAMRDMGVLSEATGAQLIALARGVRPETPAEPRPVRWGKFSGPKEE